MSFLDDKLGGIVGTGLGGLGNIVDIPTIADIPDGPWKKVLGFLGTIIPWLFNSPKVPQPTWSLCIYDEKDKPLNKRTGLLLGMYDPVSFSVSDRNMLSEISAMGISAILQQGPEGAKTISLTGHWDARHNEEDLTDLYDTAVVKYFNSIDPLTGSKPILFFQYREIAYPVVLESVTYRRGESNWGKGFPKWIEMDLTLKRINMEGAKPPPEQGGPEVDTFYHILVAGQTYEEAARLYYGSPDHAMFIRLRNQDIIEEQAGDQIEIPPAGHSDLRQKLSISTLNPVFFDADGLAAMLEFALANEDGGASYDYHYGIVTGVESEWAAMTWNAQFTAMPDGVEVSFCFDTVARPDSVALFADGVRIAQNVLTFDDLVNRCGILFASAPSAVAASWFADYEALDSGDTTTMVRGAAMTLITGTTDEYELASGEWDMGSTQVWHGTAATMDDFVLMHRNGASGYTYKEIGCNRIKLGAALAGGKTIIVDYVGRGGRSDLVVNEIPTGLVDGANSTFTTVQNFDAGSTQVYYKAAGASQGGIRQVLDSAYTETDDNEITFTAPPGAGGTVIISYQRQV